MINYRVLGSVLTICRLCYLTLWLTHLMLFSWETRAAGSDTSVPALWQAANWVCFKTLASITPKVKWERHMSSCKLGLNKCTHSLCLHLTAMWTASATLFLLGLTPSAQFLSLCSTMLPVYNHIGLPFPLQLFSWPCVEIEPPSGAVKNPQCWHGP